MDELRCPYCQSETEYVPATKVYRRGGFGFLYLCATFPVCDSYVSAGDDGKPMGTLANRDLREKRKRLFTLIDKISAENKAPRQEAVSHQ
jgi:zinc-finger-containing domain